MKCLHQIKRHISLALAGQKPYGDGFNADIEVWCAHPGEAEVSRVLARIDHQHLGLDVDLGISGLPSLVKWIFDQLESVGATSVRLTRGDGLSVSYSPNSRVDPSSYTDTPR